MKTLTPQLTGILYGQNVHQAADLYTFTFPAAYGGTQYWTTADRAVVSGGITFQPGGTVFTTSTSGEVQSIPTTSSKGNVSIIAGFSYADVGSINASAGQTIYFAVSAQNQNGTGEAVITPSFTVNGNGNTISEIVSATLAGYYAERIFTCTVGGALTNATARFSLNNSEQRGAISYVVFSNVDPVQGNTKSVYTALGSAVNPVTASLTSTRASSSFIWAQKLGTNTPVGWTGSALLYSYQYCGNGLFTGSVTSPGQTVTVGVSDSSPSWDYIFAIAEVRGNYSSGGTVYSSSTTGPNLERGTTRTTARLEIDTLDLTIHPGQFTLGGTAMSLAAIQGAFSKVPVRVERAYFPSSSWGSVVGTSVIFQGFVTEVRPQSTKIELTVKSALSLMETPTPRRVVQASCPFVLYGTECGVSSASFQSARTATSGSTTSVIKDAGTLTDGQWKGGRLTIGSVNRVIVGNSTNSFTVYPPLPSAPASGSAFTVVRGCAKNFYECSGTFGNGARYGGFQNMPKVTS